MNQPVKKSENNRKEVSISEVWDYVLTHRKTDEDHLHEPKKSNYFISAVPAPPASWRTRRQNISNSIAQRCFDDLVYSYNKKLQQSGVDFIEDKAVVDMPYSKPTFLSMCKQIGTNYVFDFAFLGLDYIGYKTKTACTCPCSRQNSAWQELLGIDLHETDYCSLSTTITPVQLYDHLQSHKGWFHYAITVFIQTLYSKFIDMSDDDDESSHFLKHWVL